MNKRLWLWTVLLFIAINSYAAGPRTWGKSGTATNVNATLSVKDSSGTTFTPTAMCFTNTDTAVDYFIDYTDGVATTTDDSSNIKVIHGTTSCFSFNQPNPTGPFTIGIITAASTAGYNAFAIAAK